MGLGKSDITATALWFFECGSVSVCRELRSEGFPIDGWVTALRSETPHKPGFPLAADAWPLSRVGY